MTDHEAEVKYLREALQEIYVLIVKRQADRALRTIRRALSHGRST
jgi:hypothetical protein